MDPKDERPARWPTLNAREMLRRLSAAEVDFVVIGGIAMVLHGSPRLTRDLDIVFASGLRNLRRLGGVLLELDAKLRDVDTPSPSFPIHPPSGTSSSSPSAHRRAGSTFIAPYRE